ncbi:MAG: hypothetical protein FJX72_03960 [Armatimonadetes bacterium]|nr:hypothetical protein [Armatimonadota bacterium]
MSVEASGAGLGHRAPGTTRAKERVAPAHLLPRGRLADPSYASLAGGPLRVRLLKGTQKPTFGHYAVAAGASMQNLISHARRSGIGGSWMIMGGAGRSAYDDYMATGWPVIVSQFVVPVNEKRLDDDPAHATEVKRATAAASAYFSYLMAEWENYVWAWWMDVDTKPMLGKTDAELRAMDRRGHYDLVIAALREWKRRAGGHLSLMTGHGLQSHVAEIGLDAVCIETSENIAATQVKRAYCRGAARQFGIPWTESVSVWFGPSFTAPNREPRTNSAWEGVTIGGEAGHSLSHMERIWYTSWFAGAADVNQETSTQLLFEDQADMTAFRAEPKLSRFGDAADLFCRHMRSIDVGVPYVPFGVIVRKDHGRWTNWSDPWGRYPQTLGDKLTSRFFDQLFPGQSLGPGDEERYLCPSPYGDTFDVLVNDADRTAWGAHRALIAVGEVPWTDDDIGALTSYARRGGVLVLHEVNLAGWDRALVGLAPNEFRPGKGAEAVLQFSGGTPSLIRRKLGRGWVFVVGTGPSDDAAQAVPDALLSELARRYLPCEVTGTVQTLINRTPDGWLMLLVNNGGIKKTFTKREVIDPNGAQHVRVRFAGARPVVEELMRNDAPEVSAAGRARGWDVRVTVPPGEMRMLRVQQGRARAVGTTAAEL